MKSKLLAVATSAALIFGNMGAIVQAADTGLQEGEVISVSQMSDLQEGTYQLDAALSCYVNAMGGIEFGAPLLQDTKLSVAEDGTANMTLSFGTSSITIYGVTTNTYIGEAYGSDQAFTGYLDGAEWKQAEYTLSSEKVTSSSQAEVSYINSMTFPISTVSDTYSLAMAVDSNTMGVQFGNGANYDATLTVDWSNVTVVDIVEDSTTEDGTTEDGTTDTVVTTIDRTDLAAGTYEVEASVAGTAMHGMDFAGAVYKSTVLDVAEDGTAVLTIYFDKGSATVYGQTIEVYALDGDYGNAEVVKNEDGSVASTAFTVDLKALASSYELLMKAGMLNGSSMQYGGESATVFKDGTVCEAAITLNLNSLPEVSTGDTIIPEDTTTPNDTITSDDTIISNDTTNSGGTTSTENVTNTENTTSTDKVISVARLSDLAPGKYGLDASLSCYVNAMGGVEFGSPLLQNAVLNVAEDGTANITLSFGTSSVTIYGVTADTYVGTSTDKGAGVIGYYDGSAWQNASYTLNDTGYVSTMTFPITNIQNTYELALVIGSNVMSTQFGAGANYNATLSVNWNQVVVDGDGDGNVSGAGLVKAVSPKTGDTFPILPIVGIMSSCAVAFVLLQVKRKVSE
ncbi:MAG: hypothetical protein IAA25_00190 [Candidatus Ruminococcus intestinipullorum]|nr:hypothetical protein [Candidatus Ruminococcus intestinipullorum]